MYERRDDMRRGKETMLIKHRGILIQISRGLVFCIVRYVFDGSLTGILITMDGIKVSSNHGFISI